MNNVANPACKDNITELSERNTTAESSLVASLTDAVSTAITFDQGNIDGADVNETYFLNSESEISRAYKTELLASIITLYRQRISQIFIWLVRQQKGLLYFQKILKGH